MAIVTGNSISAILCDILGLDKKMVRGLTIRAYVEEVAIVTVEMYVPRESMDSEHISELKSYKVIPIEV